MYINNINFDICNLKTRMNNNNNNNNTIKKNQLLIKENCPTKILKEYTGERSMNRAKNARDRAATA